MAADQRIKIPRLIWMNLVGELHRRGRGRRESGAFLLGRAADEDRRVARFVCYDELDPEALETGIVMFHARGLSALWALCSEQSLEVMADVHTHPTSDVRQSSIDQEHPMLPVKGHVALILPRYGKTSKWSLAGVGMHVFQGGRRWTSTRSDGLDPPIRLCTW